MPSLSVSTGIEASRKSTSSVNGMPPLASPSPSANAAAPAAMLSLTLNPSSALVLFCVSNTSNRPSPSMSVEALDRPVALPVKPASVVSFAPSLSEFVSTKSADPSLSESTGLIRASFEVAALEAASNVSPLSALRLSKLSSRPSWFTSVKPGVPPTPDGAIYPEVV